jgi:hypothetical protein
MIRRRCHKAGGSYIKAFANVAVKVTRTHKLILGMAWTPPGLLVYVKTLFPVDGHFFQYTLGKCKGQSGKAGIQDGQDHAHDGKGKTGVVHGIVGLVFFGVASSLAIVVSDLK